MTPPPPRFPHRLDGAVMQTGTCGCNITGDGTLPSPLKIEYCGTHAGHSQAGQTQSEEAARWRKIAHMLAAALNYNVGMDELHAFRRGHWNIIAVAGRVNAPSEATVKMAIAVLDHVSALPEEQEDD